MEHSKTISDVSSMEEELSNECEQLMLTLPEEKWGDFPIRLHQYQGLWVPTYLLQGVIAVQRHFQAHDTDIIVASKPKSGTTWLKALVFATMNRKNHYTHDDSQNSLLTYNSHHLVPFLESHQLYGETCDPNLTKIASPRLLSSHIPYMLLPGSIKTTSNCRIVYICRNPFDTFVSSYNFLGLKIKNLCMEETFDKFCEGVGLFGPFFDHVLGYWKESLERPEKVLFLKYEDLKQDIGFELRRLAEFLGVPFSEEEEREGVIEEISKMCSFGKQRDLEVNQSGNTLLYFDNKDLFRKGEVGDYVNYLTPTMVERLDKLMQEKLADSGLTFKLSL